MRSFELSDISRFHTTFEKLVTHAPVCNRKSAFIVIGRMRDFFTAGFDPALIVGQICALQALLYLGLGAWLLLLNGLAGQPATAEHCRQEHAHLHAAAQTVGDADASLAGE